MKPHRAILIATLLTPLTAFGATVPYKEVMRESVKENRARIGGAFTCVLFIKGLSECECSYVSDFRSIARTLVLRQG